jgi:hypothetical protein
VQIRLYGSSSPPALIGGSPQPAEVADALAALAPTGLLKRAGAAHALAVPALDCPGPLL